MPTPGPIPQVDLLSGKSAFIAAHSDLLQQKFDGKGKISPPAGSAKSNNAALGNFVDDVILAFVDAVETGAISGDLPAVLANGNTTGGTNIEISAGDLITSPVATNIPITPGAGGIVELNADAEMGGDLLPDVDGTRSVGTIAKAFADGRFVDFLVENGLTVEGNVDLDSPNAQLNVGDGGGAGTLRTFGDNTANRVHWEIRDQSTQVWRWTLLTSGTWQLTNNAGGHTWSFQAAGTTLFPNSVTISAGDLTLDSASPITSFGDFAGSPNTQFRKTAAGFAQLQFQTAATTNDKRLLFDTDETLKLQSHNGAVYADGLTLDNNADVLIENQLLVAGAAAGDAVALATNIVVGDGNDCGITLFNGVSNEGRISFADAAGAMRGEIKWEDTFDTFTWSTAGAVRMRLSSQNLRPFSNGLIGLGVTSIRFTECWADNVIAQDGIQLGDTVADGPTEFGGTGIPAAGLGVNGDYYFRDDAGAGTHIYFKTAGAWAAFA